MCWRGGSGGNITWCEIGIDGIWDGGIYLNSGQIQKQNKEVVNKNQNMTLLLIPPRLDHRTPKCTSSSPGSAE